MNIFNHSSDFSSCNSEFIVYKSDLFFPDSDKKNGSNLRILTFSPNLNSQLCYIIYFLQLRVNVCKIKTVRCI